MVAAMNHSHPPPWRMLCEVVDGMEVQRCMFKGCQVIRTTSDHEEKRYYNGKTNSTSRERQARGVANRRKRAAGA